LQNGHADDAAKILKELLTIEPENKDARMELAAAHLSASRPGQALVELLQIERVDPDQAPRFFTIDGFARMQMGDREGARIAATKLAEIAKTPQDRSQAERLQTYLGEADARAALVGNLREQPVAESPTEAAAPPRLVRRVEESLSSLSGSLVEVNCGAAEHSFAIGTAQGKKIFVVDEKKGVNITGRETEFSCGAQKPAPSVKIEFVPVTDRAGIDGVVRAIHFEP
jgi:tetratricopeptide (TPR) repeat protein